MLPVPKHMACDEWRNSFRPTRPVSVFPGEEAPLPYTMYSLALFMSLSGVKDEDRGREEKIYQHNILS